MYTLKKLIVLRHGNYDRKSGDLDDLGVSQIKVSASKIAKEIGSEKVLILSSTAKRAEQSASILSKALSAMIKSSDTLSEENKIVDTIKAVNIIKEMSREFTATAIVVVTHESYSEILPFQAYREFRGEKKVFDNKLDYGEYVVVF